MLTRLSLGGLSINQEHITILDVYSSERAKRGLESGIDLQEHLFDNISEIVISPAGQARPILLPDFELLQRNEFYGVNRTYFPAQALGDVFERVFMDTEIQLPEPREGEQPAPKHSLLKYATYPGQIGIDIQLEFGPQVALDLTQRLRDYLPAELLKGVTSFYRTPELSRA